MTEERLGEGGVAAALVEGGAIEMVKYLPLLGTGAVPVQNLDLDALFGDTAPFTFELLTFLCTEGDKKVVECPVVAVVPMELGSGTAHQALLLQELHIGRVGKKPV